MLVFRDGSRIADVQVSIRQCRAAWKTELRRAAPDYEACVALLIDIGELECALVDAAAKHSDTSSSLTRFLRGIALSTSHLLRAAWRRQTPEATLLRTAEAEAAWTFLEGAPLPKLARMRTAEGYSQYGLYPEMYLEAAAQFAGNVNPGTHALCLGLRSIGGGLSAVVAAELEARGLTVRTDTVRPRGHPWNRELVIDDSLRRAWSRWTQGYGLIIDEGPGLSGSSFAGTAAALEEAGFDRSRIVLFPSWNPPAEQLRSERAKDTWSRYQKILVPFESACLHRWQGRFGPLRDLSAGAWRRELYSDQTQYPPVQPQHERRKYLGLEPGSPLLKFIGLGRYARPRLRRARTLADLGLSPAVHGAHHGFLHMERITGTPLRPQVRPPQTLLTAMASYLLAIRQEFPSTQAACFEPHLEMMQCNLGNTLTACRRQRLERYRGLVSDTGATGIDGRMLPHEWLVADGGYLKTDSTDHCDDHFYPREDDIAWDVAGACVEFGFGREARRALAQQVAQATRDPALTQRLPFSTVAYLGYRIGYAGLAAQTLVDSPDGRRFQRLLARYRRQEQRAWAELEAACPSRSS